MSMRAALAVSVVVCLLVCPALSTHALAQPSIGGSIRGQVVDEQQAALPGVRVTATAADVPAIPVTVSDTTGAFRLVDLAPGTYTIVAELPGFARWVREAVVV